MAPAEGVSGGARRGVGEHRYDEEVAVPEHVAIVPRAGQPFGRDPPALGPCAGREYLKQRKPNRLLKLGVAFELDVAGCPEVVEVPSLCRDERIPTRGPCGEEGGRNLIPHCRLGPLVRPPVRHELDEPQQLTRLEDVGRYDPGRIGRGLVHDL